MLTGDATWGDRFEESVADDRMLRGHGLSVAETTARLDRVVSVDIEIADQVWRACAMR